MESGGGVKKSQQKYNLRTATIMHTDTRTLYMHATYCTVFFYKLPLNFRRFTGLVFYCRNQIQMTIVVCRDFQILDSNQNQT